MGHSYPILLDVTGRTIVIVGGGAVAARKARGLIDAGASCVCCVAPAFSDDLPPRVRRVAEPYRSEHLDGADLVFAATDRAEVNDAVVTDARARRIWVNRADESEDHPGDFSVPAKLARGAIIVTVSAGNPALAAKIRDGLADRFDPRWQAMAEAMAALRPTIKSAVVSGDLRRRIFRELADEEALTLLAVGGPAALAAWLLERYPELDHA